MNGKSQQFRHWQNRLRDTVTLLSSAAVLASCFEVQAYAQTPTPNAVDSSLNPVANRAPSGQPSDQPDSAARAVALNKLLGYRGWDVPFPSFADSLVQDQAGWRTNLAKYSIGLLFYNNTIAEANVLNTPRGVPSSFPACTRTSNEAGSMCAGNRSYFGQRPDVYNSTSGILTYDTSRFGVPDGLMTIGASFSQSTDLAFNPEVGKVNILSYYQTLFNHRLEIEAGILEATQEFIGQTVGGNYASVFGPSGTIPNQLGLSGLNAGTPMVRDTLHVTGDPKNGIYNETAVTRSLPINGFFPGANQNENLTNPTGFDFLSPVTGTGAIFIDEAGYRQESLAGQKGTWLRAGTIYNTSKFKDLSQLATNALATTNGSYGSAYILADQQMLQFDPSKPGRGIYGGVSYMYASPKVASFTQYLEGRVYAKGPFASRPQDQVSFIYDRNTVSPFIADAPTATNASTGVSTRHYINSYTFSYVYRIAPGAYVSAGLGYTDHPSVRYFTREGSSLNLLSSVFLVL